MFSSSHGSNNYDLKELISMKNIQELLNVSRDLRSDKRSSSVFIYVYIKLAIMLESPKLICQSWPEFEEMKHWHITWLQNLDDNFGGCSSTH